MVSGKSPGHHTQSSCPLAKNRSTLEAPITPVSFKYFFTSLTAIKPNLTQNSEQGNSWKQSTDWDLYLERSSIIPSGEMANLLAPGQDNLHSHQNDWESSFHKYSFEEEISWAPESAKHYVQELGVPAAPKSVLVMKRSPLFPWREIEPRYSCLCVYYLEQSCWFPPSPLISPPETQ